MRKRSAANKPRNIESALQNFRVSKVFPNIITLTGLCAGLTATRFALDGKWEIACILIIFAGVLDGMDGRVARLLRVTSKFGAQLDSLADFASFGVAPALVLYLWILNKIEIPRIGWAVVLFYIICMVFRLARFNTHIEDEKKKNTEIFFTGVAAPGGAGLAITPMIVSFEFPNISFDPWLIAIYLTIVGMLVASRIPTYSVNKFLIKKEYLMAFYVFTGLIIVSMIIEPWFMFIIFALTYLISIPISIYHYRKLTLK